VKPSYIIIPLLTAALLSRCGLAPAQTRTTHLYTNGGTPAGYIISTPKADFLYTPGGEPAGYTVRDNPRDYTPPPRQYIPSRLVPVQRVNRQGRLVTDYYPMEDILED